MMIMIFVTKTTKPKQRILADWLSVDWARLWHLISHLPLSLAICAECETIIVATVVHSESPKRVFDIIQRYFIDRVDQLVVYYDFCCGLSEYIENHDPLLASRIRLYHDK